MDLRAEDLPAVLLKTTCPFFLFVLIKNCSFVLKAGISGELTLVMFLVTWFMVTLNLLGQNVERVKGCLSLF